MAQTINRVIVGNKWISLNAVTGIPIGTQFKIQNLDPRLGGLLAEGNMPVVDKIGDIINKRNTFGSSILVAKDSLQIWVRSESDISDIELSVQLV